MTKMHLIRLKTLETLAIYWQLIRIIVPVAIGTKFLIEAGVIETVAPQLAPVMDLYGLPPELALAWLTGILVGIWAAAAMIFALVPASAMSVADITVFSALLLFAHGLPIEQKIIQKAGPRIVFTTLTRLAGGMIYAALLHQIYATTGWLSQPLDPVWMPMQEAAGWTGFFENLIETLVSMLAILTGLAWLLEGLRASGLMTWLNLALAPIFSLAGIHGAARQLTAVGMFLGVSYGGGLLIREASAASLEPRQVLLSCVFMGFAHGVIEDTLVVMALGADITGVLFGRLVFSIAATAMIAWIVRSLSDQAFYTWLYARRRSPVNGDPLRASSL